MAEVADVILRWMILLVVLFAVGYVTRTFSGYPRRVFLTWAAATPVLLIAVNLAMQEVKQRFLVNAVETRSAVIAGFNTTSYELARRLQSHSGMRVEMVGFFDDRSKDRLGMDGEVNLLGTLSDMSQYVKENRTDVIFIALPIRHVKRVMDLLDDLRDTTASIYYVPDIFVFNLIQARPTEIHGIPVVAMLETPFYGYRGVAKRVTDVGFSTLILLLLLPLLVLIALAIRLTSAGPGHFHAAPLRLGRQRDRDLQVSHHAGDRGWRRRSVRPPKPTAASPPSAGCCAARPWTNCRSSSMSCRAG